jgi:tetratricopeptide (TPR) repeat protein
VKRAFLLLLRWFFVAVVSFSVAFCMMHYGRRTVWYKTHLYEQLVTGDSDERLHAASVLAEVGGEEQLLAALHVDIPEVHTMARRALEHLWFYAAGQRAYDLMQSAYAAAEEKNFGDALRILDLVTTEFPEYAEGWNRRAAVLWQLGQYEESMSDCEQALSLNPIHYGAWQGLGICHLQLGDLYEACQALRAALEILPHDDPTRESLERCEQLMEPELPGMQPDYHTDLL